MMRNKILIVEDDSDLVFIIKTALENGGYSVRSAADGLQALERVREEIPDLILLDLMLPEMDGYSVNLKLKENPQTAMVPVVVLTAYGHLKEFEQIRKDVTIVAYLEKPTPMKEILAVIGRVLKFAE